MRSARRYACRPGLVLGQAIRPTRRVVAPGIGSPARAARGRTRLGSGCYPVGPLQVDQISCVTSSTLRVATRCPARTLGKLVRHSRGECPQALSNSATTCWSPHARHTQRPVSATAASCSGATVSEPFRPNASPHRELNCDALPAHLGGGPEMCGDPLCDVVPAARLAHKLMRASPHHS